MNHTVKLNTQNNMEECFLLIHLINKHFHGLLSKCSKRHRNNHIQSSIGNYKMSFCNKFCHFMIIELSLQLYKKKTPTKYQKVYYTSQSILSFGQIIRKEGKLCFTT